MKSIFRTCTAACLTGLFPAAHSQGQVAGTLDISFLPFAGTNDAPNGLVVQPDGRILLGGSFTAVNFQTRPRIARLADDGSVESLAIFSSDAALSSFAHDCLVLQGDGKMVTGGHFLVARRLGNGQLDPDFNPSVTVPQGTNEVVNCAAVQPDGKIIVGGEFATLGGVPRRGLGRLLPDGTVDTGFQASVAAGRVHCIAVQTDGKILVGGQFTSVNDEPRNNIARLNADGTLENVITFDPGTGASGGVGPAVHSLVVQPDGKILVGGQFTRFNGQARTNLVRLLPNGVLETTATFKAVNFGGGIPTSLALQTNGRLIAGGTFTSINGLTRNHVARLLPDGSLEDTATFNAGSGTDMEVRSVAMQGDGKILLGGMFTSFNGSPRNRLARLINDPAVQTLDISTRTRIVWMRSGAAPEVGMVSFESSVDGGSHWNPVGQGTRISGGWEWTGAPLPSVVTVRALGRTSGGLNNSSHGLVQSQVFMDYGTSAPEIAVEHVSGAALADGGSTDFGAHFAGGAASRTFTIRNTGDGPLTGISVTRDGPDAALFTVTAPPAAFVSIGGSTTFTVQFAPAGTGQRTAALHIASNDADENPFDIVLTGTAATGPADIAVEQPAGTNLTDGGATGFGNAATGATVSRTFKLKNTGAAELNGLIITKDGPDAGMFTVSGPAAGSLIQGAETDFTVQFTPVTPGTKTAILHIASNDPDEFPFDISLSGKGIPFSTPAGLPDATFGGDGMADSVTGSGRCVQVVSGGKILVAGFVAGTGGNDFALLRYHAGGNLDTSFSGDGLVATDFGGDDRAHSMVIQSDGKILLAGSTSADGQAFALARYHPDGTLDTAFNGTGKVTTNFGIFTDTAYSVALQSDGRIVAAGESMSTADAAGPSSFAVARYSSGGALDAAFGGNGKVLVLIGVSSSCRSVAVLSDGKVLMGGTSDKEPGHSVLTVVRLNAGGQPDLSFGGGTACVLTDFGISAAGHAMVLRSDGKILVAGGADAGTGTYRDFALARYLSDGSPDLGFNNTGRVAIPFSAGDETGYALALQDDGKILVAGDLSAGVERDIGLVRYHPDGSPDTGFGTQGFVLANPGTVDHAAALALQNDGKILVAGDAGGQSVALLRFTGGGVPQAEMLVEQPAGTWFPPGGSTNFGIVLDGTSESMTFTVANTGYADLTDLALSLDGPDAGLFTVTTPPPPEIGFGDPPVTFTVRFTPAGNGLKTAVLHVHSNSAGANPFDIILTGTATETEVPPDIAVEQTAGGPVPDGGTQDFGTVPAGNAVTLPFTIRNTGGVGLTGLTLSLTGPDAPMFAITAQPVAPVISGAATHFSVRFIPTGPGAKSAVLHIASNDADENPYDITLTGNGIPFPGIHRQSDVTFGGTGLVITPVGAGEDVARSVAVQSDGKILVAGSAWNAADSDFAVVRYLPNGSLDTGFNGTGIVTTDFDGYETGTGMALQGDGRIVVAGQTTFDDTSNFAIARYLTNGSLDTGFNFSGKLTFDIGANHDTGWSVAVQNDGRVFVGGSSRPFAGASDFALISISPAGVPELFNTTTITTIPDRFPMHSEGLKLLMQNDGRVLVAGTALAHGESIAAVARYRMTDLGLDTSSYGNSGVARTAGFPAPEVMTAAALQTDGKLILAGGTTDSAGEDHMAMARFLPGGTMDTAYGNGGVVTATIHGRPAVPRAAVLQQDGKLLVAGNCDGELFLMRFNATGILDQAFNGRGWLTAVTGAGTQPNPSAITLQSDGRIVVAGTVNGGAGLDFFTARFRGDVPTPAIVVERPGGFALNPGGTLNWSTLVTGGNDTLRLTVRNQGTIDLSGLLVKKGTPGTPQDFLITGPATANVAPGHAATFDIRFSPSGGGERTARLEIYSNDSEENPFTLLLTGPGTGLTASEAWRMAHFGASENAGPGADLSDPDGDGLANLVEFATGSDPLAGTPPVWQMVKRELNLECTYARSISALGELDCRVQSADNPTGPWTNADPGAETVVSDDGTRQLVRVTVPAGGAGRKYVRLWVVRK